METSVYMEIKFLDKMTSGELKRKYLEVFGERALEIANDADLRVRLPRVKGEEGSTEFESRTIAVRLSRRRTAVCQDPELYSFENTGAIPMWLKHWIRASSTTTGDSDHSRQLPRK